MKRLNHFKKAQLKLTVQYFLVSVIIIVLANFIAIEVQRRTVLPALLQPESGAIVKHSRIELKFRADKVHAVFIRRLLYFDAHLLLIAVGAAYLLSGRALKPIGEMVRRQEEFASDVSHELRTPLATISMEIEALRRAEKKLPPAYSDLLDSIQEETRQMTDTVSGLLTLVRPDSAAEGNAYLPLDLASIAVQAIDRVATGAAAKNIFVAAAKLDKAPTVGNEEQIRQAVLILLDNALRYTPGGGTVSLATESANKISSLSVADTGMGIPKGDQARIFDRFYRATDKQVNAEHGTGLGLAIARKIIEGFGGAIVVSSVPGTGSLFTIKLPHHS